jgi:hypothetical protein
MAAGQENLWILESGYPAWSTTGENWNIGILYIPLVATS